MDTDRTEGASVFVVTIDNDHELYVSHAYPTRALAEEQLAGVRAEWADRYGAAAFEDTGDADDVEVLDGPWARLHEIAVVDTASSASRQHYIETGRYLTVAEVAEYA